MDPTTIKTAAAPLRAVLTGGGTGGHLFPGVAICRELEQRFPGTAILFIGTGRPLERRVIAAAGYGHAIVTVKGFKGMGLLRKLAALSVLPFSVFRAAAVLWRFKPQVVIGVGGYAAGPVCLAAYLLRIPVCLQEQNLLPGITNRLLARLARRIYIAFNGRVASFPVEKVLVTGNPVRAEIRRLAEPPPTGAQRRTVYGLDRGWQPGCPWHQRRCGRNAGLRLRSEQHPFHPPNRGGRSGTHAPGLSGRQPES